MVHIYEGAKVKINKMEKEFWIVQVLTDEEVQDN